MAFTGNIRLPNTIADKSGVGYCMFLLNGVIFIIIGLQLPPIVTGFSKEELFTMIGYGLLNKPGNDNHQNIMGDCRRLSSVSFKTKGKQPVE